MQTHLHTQVNRKVSRFIMGEEGKVGSQSAFTAAAFIGATSLAGMLLSAPDAAADNNCGDQGANCTYDDPWCCFCWDAEANQGYDNCIQDKYLCKSGDEAPSGPGFSCWNVVH
ncbi:hypothetical protein C6503_26585 [Candidatus Poribacteria bacterium]|nr:MAG: hypothetical protein C6503_26585 [Candidatus Poribacteria bacterium]